ncbi:dihydrofolate reductase family protein [Fimbriimonas ginsengisoli]|uniref:dihydrofolate reductase family protein n=1 Tax=Fimbriimonas ginsengisoli TaxID=1005039 RepID=UPI00046D2242|nr:dihydrofolate reductase family protein [Fimbriimonas ginsengisoli]
MTIILFIAASLDGYIAGPDDDLSWLFTDADYGFSDFYAGVDTLIMGRGTYEVIRSFPEWPYEDTRTIVVSRSCDVEVDTPETELYCKDLPGLIEYLAEEKCNRVWLVGGGELVRSFLKQGLLDEITVSMHPILLGTGVRLFPGGFQQTMLLLKDTQVFEGGLVQLNYHVMPPDDESFE